MGRSGPSTYLQRSLWLAFYVLCAGSFPSLLALAISCLTIRQKPTRVELSNEGLESDIATYLPVRARVVVLTHLCGDQSESTSSLIICASTSVAQLALARRCAFQLALVRSWCEGAGRGGDAPLLSKSSSMIFSSKDPSANFWISAEVS